MALNIFLLFWIAIAIGFSYVFIKMGEESLAPITEMAFRALIGFIGLLVLSLVLRKDLIGHLKDFWRFLVFAILSIVILWLTLAFGEEYVAAGVSSVTITTMPLMTFIIMVFILRKQNFSSLGMAGLIIAILGIVLVVGINNIIHGGTTIIGVLIILGGIVFFTINGILVPIIGKGIDTIVTTTYFVGIASVILWIIAFIFEQPLNSTITDKGIIAELYMGLISTASAFIAYYLLIKRAGPFFASISFYFVPIFGVIGSFLILGERMNWLQIVGIAIVLFGVYLINREKFKKTGS